MTNDFRLYFRNAKYFIILGFMLVLISGGQTLGYSEAKISAVSASRAFLLGILQTNTKQITIRLTGSGPVFSVKDLSGKTVAEQFTMDQLQSSYPDLAQVVATGLAGNDARLVVFD